MNCPHCHEKIAADYSALRCPYCGKNFSAPPNDSAKAPPPRRFGWLAFCLVLSLPAIAVWVVPFGSFRGLDALGVMIMVSIVGSVASGMGCGIMLARWKGGTVGHQISTGILFSVLLAIVSFAICCASCAVPALIGGMVR